MTKWCRATAGPAKCQRSFGCGYTTLSSTTPKSFMTGICKSHYTKCIRKVWLKCEQVMDAFIDILDSKSFPISTMQNL
jgi:hypothetical protein